MMRNQSATKMQLRADSMASAMASYVSSPSTYHWAGMDACGGRNDEYLFRLPCNDQCETHVIHYTAPTCFRFLLVCACAMVLCAVCRVMLVPWLWQGRCHS